MRRALAADGAHATPDELQRVLGSDDAREGAKAFMEKRRRSGPGGRAPVPPRRGKFRLHRHPAYVTFRYRTMPSTTPASESPATTSATSGPTGRPRDPRIDEAVLQATRDLLEEVGYLPLTIGAIAERAGSNKPAIYRRWPTKAQLVHEAVFPAEGPEVIPDGDDLRSDIRSLVAIGLEILARPAVRAAVPGLLAEMSSNPTMHFELLGRFDVGTWGWLQQRLERAIEAGEVRAAVRSTTVLELIAGTTLVATIIQPLDSIGPDWVEDVVEIIMRGIAA